MKRSDPADWLPVRAGEFVADKYRIEELIGAGGMGCVLAATHVQLLQRVAIKFLMPDDDPDAATRFMREARAVAALSSRHVAHVLDVGTMPSGTPYLVMELLEGMTLGQRMELKPPLTIDELVTIVSQACDALGEAHRRGIVHRDVKPANIFLARTPEGETEVKLLDFGIAKTLDPRMGVELSITGTSQVLGTPRYMSPEQISSTRDVDARADVWALGVVFYEALAGVPPFVAANAFELGIRILSGEMKSLGALRPDVPERYLEIVHRCLQKDPDARYTNADEVLAAIQGRPVTPPLRQSSPRFDPLSAPAIHALAMPTQRDTSARIHRGWLVGAVLAVSVLAIALVVVTSLLLRKPAIATRADGGATSTTNTTNTTPSREPVPSSEPTAAAYASESAPLASSSKTHQPGPTPVSLKSASKPRSGTTSSPKPSAAPSSPRIPIPDQR